MDKGKVWEVFWKLLIGGLGNLIYLSATNLGEKLKERKRGNMSIGVITREVNAIGEREKKISRVKTSEKN